MRPLLIPLLLLATIAPPTVAQEAYVVIEPEAEPVLMGRVEGMLDGRAQSWEFFDSSVGALDASARVQGGEDGPELFLMAAPAGQPHKRDGALLLAGRMDSALSRGPVAEPLVVLTAEVSPFGRGWAGGVRGTRASVTIDRINRPRGEIYGTISGHFSARICYRDSERVRINPNDCRSVAGTFATRVQFSNI